ncbi:MULTISPECIES: hypothetical protein [Shouchella]|uniref:Uncharacterized protein n=2 Tax=Shouchella TaxID=2893057 RepID=A0ABY7WB45_9BACI|nr:MULTISPECIES: hypothetical protein [Shouchella]MED4127462.1 hypothetical protein [Shouchella miscanthi]WDF03930.1 hypothetical protein PQ477_00120 [Shouchella hunanensis]GAF22697.1 hypothetical protein JCM19047_2458 [Bacillus sp. JCM 19047]
MLIRKVDVFIVMIALIGLLTMRVIPLQSKPVAYVNNRPTFYTINQKSKMGRLFRILLQ